MCPLITRSISKYTAIFFLTSKHIPKTTIFVFLYTSLLKIAENLGFADKSLVTDFSAKSSFTVIVTSFTIENFSKFTFFSKILSKLTKFSKILSKFTFFSNILSKIDKSFEIFRKKCQFGKYFRKFCNGR